VDEENDQHSGIESEMTKEESKKLRRHMKSLQGFQDILAERIEKGHHNIDQKIGNQLSLRAGEMYSAFPTLVPYFDLGSHYSHVDAGGDSWYSIDSLRAYLYAAIGALEVELSEEDETPVVEPRTFGFVSDSSTRSILERDYRELQHAYVAKCWKSAIILAGGLLEAMLLDKLKANQNATLASPKSPKNTDIDRWSLQNLITVATDLSFISSGADKLSHSVREYRNLVHPANEVRNNLKVQQEEARIALEVVRLVYRDLEQALRSRLVAYSAIP
jgi:hypothetical protein